MRVSDTLRSEAIVTGVTWPDFAGVVQGLVGRLTETGDLPASLEKAAVAAVIEREHVASTAMVDIGVSIPHSRLDGLNRLVSALALAPGGVYGAPAGTPISIVFLVLSPSSLVGDHLNFLSALSMLLHSAPFRRNLQAARTADDVLAIVRASERR
jgi:mannitol/fructose-specific phosphotransferase system IIA component (Ntr-type)